MTSTEPREVGLTDGSVSDASLTDESVSDAASISASSTKLSAARLAASEPATIAPWQGAKVQAFLSDMLGEHKLARARITRLSGGLSNDNAEINLDGEAFVLRINRDASSWLCQRAFEAQNWQRAADAGLAPKLLGQSADGRCYLAVKLQEGGWHQKYREWPVSAFRQLVKFAPLGKTSKPVDAAGAHQHAHVSDHANTHGNTHANAHTCADASVQAITETIPEAVPADARLLLDLLSGLAALSPCDNQLSFHEQWQLYQTRLNAHQSAWQHNPAWLSAADAFTSHTPLISAALQRLDAKAFTPQFCHRDLTPHNLLHHQGQLYCIDFEYACASHPLWDLACVLATHDLSDASRLSLITGYVQCHRELGFDDVPLLWDAIAMYWYFAAIWALLMAGQTEDMAYLDWFYAYLAKASD